MNTKPGPRGALLALLLAVVAGLLLLWADAPALQLLRHYQFDQFQRWHPGSDADQGVRIVDIDDASLQRLGQWPWSRSQLASLLDRLGSGGARVVAFDVVFAEPDRMAPARLSAQWPLRADQRAALLALPDPDRVFAQSLRQTPSVLGYALLNSAQAQASAPVLAAPAARLVEVGPSQRAGLPRAPGALAPLPLLQAAASGQGALGFVPDGDGVVRRVPLLLQVADTTVPTLVSETLRVQQQAPNLVLTSAADGSGLASLRIGRISLPTTAQGELWLHYHQPQAQRRLPAWAVLQGAVPASAWAGAVVLVGSSAQGLMDLRFGPLGQLPGVEVHAQALEQALGGHSLQRPAWAQGLEALALLGGCALLAWLALRRAALVAAVGALSLLALALGLAWWAFVAHDVLLDAATPALAWLLCYLLCSLWQQRQRERQQRWIRQAFARYVSPNRVAWLLAHPQAFALGGRRQQCSFVFTDLTGFTALMESLDPAQAVGLLNTYLDAMVAIAFRFEGTLDRIVGDAVAIMFSAPVEQADHRARALACALEMDAFAVRFARQQQGIRLGQTRIGVHCGEVIVGNFGGHAVFDYRALGDPVNTAARLESANKQLGTRVCVSDAILRGQSAVPVRPVGRVLLHGKHQALAVFEPLSTAAVDAHDGDAQRAPLPAYVAAFEAMQEQQPQAPELFAQLARAWPLDPLVRLHHARLAAGERGAQITLREK